MRDVRISDQVCDYIRQLPPLPKKRLRAGLRGLAELKGDIKDLERQLDGYCRLPVHQFRIILKFVQNALIVFLSNDAILYMSSFKPA